MRREVIGTASCTAGNRTIATRSIGSGASAHTPFFPEVRARALALYNETSAPSAALASIGRAIADNAAWDAAQFIDWCQAAESATDSDVVEFLQRVQVEEMRLLLAYSYRNAV